MCRAYDWKILSIHNFENKESLMTKLKSIDSSSSAKHNYGIQFDEIDSRIFAWFLKEKGK